MLISLNVCCDQHRSEAAKIEEVIARDTLSGWHECVSESGFDCLPIHCHCHYTQAIQHH
jgi:hypothetical protein